MRSTLPFELPKHTGLEELAPEVFLLSGSRGEAIQSATWEALKINGLSRYLAFSLTSHFVTSPFFGTNLAAIPPRCQFVLWEETDGMFGVLLPVLDADFRTEAAGCAGGIAFAASCGSVGQAASKVALAVLCRAADPFRAIDLAVKQAVAWMGRGRLRAEKKTPQWIDWLGWCTWDAFYTDVDEQKILEGLQAFREGGIIPGQIIIDEGWQDCSKAKYLLSLGLKEGGFTDGRFLSLIASAKREFGVKMVGCWRTLFGQLRGVDVRSPGLSGYSRQLVHEPGTEKDTFGVVEPGDVTRFHDDYAARLAADGVDFVKVDFQSALHLMTHGQLGRAEAARLWQHSLQDSVEKHFGGEMLNCMSLGSDEVFHTRTSNVARSSDDYFPTKDESHPAHIRQNIYNALWLSQFEWPDWDMFHSKHPWAWYHAVGRAISGGPVYVSDKPGESDFSLLTRFVAADGKALRCPQPALPTREMLFSDPAAGHRLIKAFNRCGDIGLLAVFHPDPNPESPAVEEEISVGQVDGLGSASFAVFSLRDGFLGIRSPMSRRVAFREADLLVFSPVVDGFAPIGLIEKMNPPAAIVSKEFQPDGLLIEARGGGRFGVYVETQVREVCLNEVSIPFQHEKRMLTFDTGNEATCRIAIRRT